jgi:hypothetical protein
VIKVTVSTNISKVLLDLTGEPRTELAIIEIMKDAVEHRIEKIEAELKAYEDKYGMPFEDFKRKFENEEISEAHSYEVETDYLEWEGLVSRHKKYTSTLATL